MIAVRRVEHQPSADADGFRRVDPRRETRHGPPGMPDSNAWGGFDDDRGGLAIALMFHEGNVPVDFGGLRHVAVGRFPASSDLGLERYEIADDLHRCALDALNHGDRFRRPLRAILRSCRWVREI